jgi:hypothetical protein
MTTNRRDVIKGTVALAVRSALYTGGIGVATSLTSCGGGGGGGSGPAAPASLSYSSPATAVVGLASTALSPTVIGNVTTYAVSPALPAGLTLNSSTGVITGTPSAAAATATYTVTATNSAGSTNFVLTLTVNPPLAIGALSSTSPMALTPLLISTVGLDVKQPFTVALSIGAAASTPLTPYRTDTDGTIHAALPLNLDATGLSGPYSATVSVSQGPQTTPMSPALTVADIPALATYGTNIGAISHAFFNYLALSHGRVVNELQAIGTNYSSVDTSANQTLLTSFSLNALHSRNDVDRITNDTTLQIAAGTDPSGATIYYTEASVEMQDRLFGFYLNQLQGPVNATPASLAAIRSHLRRATHSRGNALGPVAGQLNLLTTVLGATITGTLGVSAGIANAVSPASNTNGLTAALDSASAVLFGATKVLAVAGLGTAGATDLAAAVTGIAGAACALTSDLIKSSNSQDQIIALQQAGASQADLTAAIDARNAARVSAVTDVLGGVLSALPASEVVKDVLDSSLAANVVYQGSALVTSVASLAADALGKQITAAQDAGNQLATVAPDAAHGFADLTGMCAISNSYAGTDLQGLYGASLSIPNSSSAAQFSSITDTSGNYDVLVPLANPALDYAGASLSVLDPSTNTLLGSEPIDLSSLTNAGDLLPLISGSCNDTDASTPDGDDPDCD